MLRGAFPHDPASIRPGRDPTGTCHHSTGTATCSLVVPYQLSIGAPNNNFVAKLASNCPATINTAVWKSTPAATMLPEGRLQFLYHAREAGFTILGEVPPIGTVTWKPAGGATDSNGVKVADLASALDRRRTATIRTGPAAIRCMSPGPAACGTSSPR
jgi:hypothetical protein